MFFITMILSRVPGEKFTEGKRYPCLDISDDQFGLRFLIPNDDGDLKYYKAEFCKYAGEKTSTEGRR